MIERLSIVRFGAFRDRDFTFGKTTVFLGPNESGKTTVFDALQECLSKPSRSRAEGKIIKQRYGDDLEATLVGAPEDPIDVDEFRNLYAVRASDLNVAIKDDVPWFSAVRSRLFSGGIDPTAVMRALEPMTSDHGGRALNKDIKQLSDKRDQLAEELAKLRARHDELLAQRELLVMQTRHQDTLLAEVTQLEQEVAAADGAASVAEQAKERFTLEEQLTKYRWHQALQKSLGEFVNLSTQQLTELYGHEKHLATIGSQLKLAEGRLADAQLVASRLEQEHASLEAELDAERSIAEAHQRLGLQLSQLKAAPPRRAVTEWHLAWIIAGVAGTAAAIGLAVWRYPDLQWLGAASALLVGGVVCILKSKRAGTVPDERTWSQKIEQISQDAGIAGDSETLARTFAATVKRHANRQEELIRLGRERVLATTRSTALQHDLQTVLGDRQQIEAAWRQALLNAGVETIERYRERLQAKAQLSAQLADLGEETLTADAALSLERRSDLLATQGTPIDASADAQWAKAIKQARQRREQLMAANAKVRDLQLGVTREEGELQGKLQDLPQSLVKLEYELAAVEADLDSKQIDKEAAVMAREVLAEMAADAETQMAGLASDIGTLWATVSNAPTVRLPRLDGKAMAAIDATGTLRSADLLSSGTRDLFLLAARLALAGRGGREHAVLVLDDPFVMMDDERRAVALTMIAAAQKQHAWQVVVLTKDHATAADVQKIMAESVIHRLDRQVLL